MMVGDVPNLAFCLGYTNASWTLKADLTAGYVCRLLNHMTKHGYDSVVPRPSRDPEMVPEGAALNLTSGYVQRAAAQMPKQGNKAPWRVYMNYVLDRMTMNFGDLADDVTEFGRAVTPLPRKSTSSVAAQAREPVFVAAGGARARCKSASQSASQPIAHSISITVQA